MLGALNSLSGYTQVPLQMTKAILWRPRQWLAIFPQDEEESSFTKVKLEVISTKHQEIHTPTWVSEDGGKERNSWVSSAYTNEIYVLRSCLTVFY